ncbi:MAG: NAD+ synthase [Candidatus Diapherotrites archaeon]|nr:NAD+ synthase [Candidatus Diapherotrites archaeon]
MSELLKRYERVVNKTADYFKKARVKKAVVGLSGGIDSALTAKLLCDALSNENVFALIMPDKITCKRDMEHAIALCKMLGIKYKVVPIDPILKEIEKTKLIKGRLARANAKARVRMLLLYSYANSKNALVVGTSNRSELELGYFTKYGDGAADILPLASFFKTEVFELAKLLQMPKEIITKKPSAGLWRGQSDEKELGMSYEKIDEILKLLEKHAKEDVLNKIPEAKRVVELIKRNSHKRQLPVVIS